MKRRQPAAMAQTTLRLPMALIERADALAGPLAALPAYAAEPLDRSAILRIAIARGLAALEREAAKKESR